MSAGRIWNTSATCQGENTKCQKFNHFPDTLIFPASKEEDLFWQKFMLKFVKQAIFGVKYDQEKKLVKC